MIFYSIFFLTAVLAFAADSEKLFPLINSILHPLFAIPLAFFIFYKGYYGAVQGIGYFTFYKLFELIFIVLGLIFVFLSLAGYHGPLFIVSELGSTKKNMAVIGLAVVETLVAFTGLWFRIICLLKVNGTLDAEPDE